LPDVVVNIGRIFADDTKYTVLWELRMTESYSMTISANYQIGQINTTKCSVMYLGHNNRKYDYDMRDNNGELQKLDESVVEDLGVYVDNKLSFHQHINTSVNKATNILGVIKRTFTIRCRCRDTIGRLYTSHVGIRNVPRTTQYGGDMDKIERLQRRATK
jgi:hypothetical protein